METKKWKNEGRWLTWNLNNEKKIKKERKENQLKKKWKREKEN